MTNQFDAIFDNPNICKIEEKFAITEEASTTPGTHTYLGKYPLQPPMAGARGTYGGELVTQGIYAAWASVPDPELSPHSLHSYFVKAGTEELPIRWQVQEISNSRNYANRYVQGFQLHNNKLLFTIQVSFVRNNSAAKRDQVGHKDGVKPLSMQRRPQGNFYKYKDELDSQPYFEHTHGLMHSYVPKEYLQAESNIDLRTRGNAEFGFFLKINDDLSKAQNPTKAKVGALAFMSDLFFLGTLAKGLGLPIAGHHFDTLNFFRVSLDHELFIHDIDFDPQQWMFIDYLFTSLNNDRVLCQVQYFTLEGKMVALVVQEALVYLGPKIIDSVRHNSAQSSTEVAKL